MSEMVDRVARAIAAVFAVNATAGQDEVVVLRVDVDAARASIAAMREPTEAMKRAYWALIGENDDGPHPTTAMNAMIDAALKER